MNQQTQLPNFNTIKINEIEKKLQGMLDNNCAEIDKLLDHSQSFTWDNLMHPLEEMDDRLHQYWSLVSHMNAVINSDELREAYNKCLPLLSDYHTKLSHNKALFNAIESIANSESFSSLDKAQQKVISNNIRDFKLAGVALPKDKKDTFAQLSKSLSQLTTKFDENVLDATQGWYKVVSDEAELAGIPDHAISAAKAAADKKEEQGWVFTLEAPSYIAVMTHADSRSLRETIYRAYTTRASDQGPKAGEWDNAEVMQKIMEQRLELARLLDFNNYAEESLATKMVDKPQQVLDFLRSLADASLPKAKEEFKALQQFAKGNLAIEQLQAWDVAYASEKKRKAEYDISQEELRPYFPEQQVLDGLFTVVNKLFGITITPVEDADTWHKDARCFAIHDKDGKLRSYFYIDLYARNNKRGGAWMDDCRGRRKLDNGNVQIPIAFVTCNFSGPVGDDPALFTHDEVVTLFHEFGHALQHMMTTINYADVAGINGIPWDAVEVASQCLENWAWQKESIGFIAKHHKTGEPLPDALFEKMHKAKNFHSAMAMVRQLEFALFDFILHIEFSPDKQHQVQSILNQVRKEISVVPTPAFNRFQNGFSHIFAGGYAAGYYSYKWAEVMASDAFSLFEEKGIFDQNTAQSYLECILEPGGSEEPAILFAKFRGREPSTDALLKQSGIIEN